MTIINRLLTHSFVQQKSKNKINPGLPRGISGIWRTFVCLEPPPNRYTITGHQRKTICAYLLPARSPHCVCVYGPAVSSDRISTIIIERPLFLSRAEGKWESLNVINENTRITPYTEARSFRRRCHCSGKTFFFFKSNSILSETNIGQKTLFVPNRTTTQRKMYRFTYGYGFWNTSFSFTRIIKSNQICYRCVVFN